MRSIKRLIVLGGLLLAMMIGAQAEVWADNPSRTVITDWERVRVVWSYTLANGDAAMSEVHRCDNRQLDSLAEPGSGSSQTDMHLCVRMMVWTPDGLLKRSTACMVESTPFSLGTDLKSVRIRGTGTGITQEEVAGVMVQRPADFSVDLIIQGTGDVTEQHTQTQWVDADGMVWLTSGDLYRRAGSCTGIAILDGTPTHPDVCTELVEMAHTRTVQTALTK